MIPPPSLSLTGLVLLGVLVGVAAIYDIRWRRIPNWLVLAGIIVGLAWNMSAGASVLAGLGTGAAGLGLGFILYFPLWLLRARGAGDVKLLAAVGSITGAGNCFWIFLLTAVLGGLIALLLVLFRGRARKTFFNVAWILRDLLQLRAPHQSNAELDVTTDKGMRLPHAAMIAVGAIAFMALTRIGTRF